MNNIEILEKFIKHYKEVQEKYKDDEIQAEIERSCYFEEVPAEAIENLIQENKELKEELEICETDLDEMTISNEHKKKEWVNKLVLNSYIPKSKVKEKIEELDKRKRKSQIEYSTIDELIFDKKIEVLQELLEEGE